jgi:hypothetical protein
VLLFWVSAQCFKKIGDGPIKLELRMMIIYQNQVLGFLMIVIIYHNWIFDLFEKL